LKLVGRGKAFKLDGVTFFAVEAYFYIKSINLVKHHRRKPVIAVAQMRTILPQYLSLLAGIKHIKFMDGHKNQYTIITSKTMHGKNQKRFAVD